VDYLRAMAGAALEQRDLDTAERLTERALSISEHGRPAFEYLALLDRAEIWAVRGQIRDALATVEAARGVLAGTAPSNLARADELEALLRLALGDLRSPAELASGPSWFISRGTVQTTGRPPTPSACRCRHSSTPRRATTPPRFTKPDTLRATRPG
jgi:hypothetical protein